MTSAVVVGLGFGDEAKGSITDYLVRKHKANLVVRFNGGPQAAHNVVTPDGRHHCFQQIGAGGFVPGVKTLISRYMLWNPFTLKSELEMFQNKVPWDPKRLHFVDERAIVVTPYHVIANRLREYNRGAERHGSCGMGIGETVADNIDFPEDTITAEHLKWGIFDKTLDQVRARKLREFQWMLDIELPRNIREQVEFLTKEEEPSRMCGRMIVASKWTSIVSPAEANRLMRDSTIVFEGAQGVLLDQDHGFHPHTTWSKTTARNAQKLSDEAVIPRPNVIGVTRSYSTRHGAGPFPTHTPGIEFDGEHNGLGEWQGAFRTGHLDLVLLKYAANVARPDQIAVTWLDVADKISVCPSYDSAWEPTAQPHGRTTIDEQLVAGEILAERKPSKIGTPSGAESLLKLIEETTYRRVRIGSWGPTHEHKKEVMG